MPSGIWRVNNLEPIETCSTMSICLTSCLLIECCREMSFAYIVGNYGKTIND